MKQHIEIIRCRKCHSTIGFDISTIGCKAKVVLFLSCEICNLQHTLVWVNGSMAFGDSNQLKLDFDEKETL